MGLNAFFAYNIVKEMGYSIEFALTEVLLEGIIVISLPAINVRVFFQADDGIRYIGVTGVQTCALPILLVHDKLGLAAVALGGHHGHPGGVGGHRGAVILTDHVQAQVQPGRYPGRGEDPAVVDEEHVDWKSVVEGKSADLGGRRLIKKKI